MLLKVLFHIIISKIFHLNLFIKKRLYLKVKIRVLEKNEYIYFQNLGYVSGFINTLETLTAKPESASKISLEVNKE